MEEAGFTNVVSVPEGANATIKQGPLPEPHKDKAFAYVWNCWSATEQAACILLATDDDAPGHALAEELARRLGMLASICSHSKVSLNHAYAPAIQLLKFSFSTGKKVLWSQMGHYWLCDCPYSYVVVAIMLMHDSLCGQVRLELQVTSSMLSTCTSLYKLLDPVRAYV